MATAKQLRKKIDSELSKDSPNYVRVNELASQLADKTSDKIRFSVEASHINRLGLELVGKQETALSELLKNAYDADATEVAVDLTEFHKPGGTLIIRDNGSGMSEGVLKDAWMRISTTSKVESPTSPKYSRTRAGRKGIGRFATQRLGRHLELTTTVEGESFANVVKFDWDNDFGEGKNLSDVWTDINQIPAVKSESSTILKITKLRDRWTEAVLRRAWKSVLFLQPPFPLTKEIEDDNDGEVVDPGFQVKINGASNHEQLSEISLKSLLLDHALAEIKGKIGSNGKAKFTVKSSTLDLKDSMVSKKTFTEVGPTRFEARYFIFAGKIVPGISTKVAKKLGDEFGGIRIHRNKFRVLPYGETRNDWLKLDADVSRRAILVPGNNANFFGHVSISRKLNPNLEEISSREGLVENDAYDELVDFTRSGLEWAITRIASARNRKTKATQKDFVSEVRKPSEIIEQEIEEIIDDFGIEHDDSDKNDTSETNRLLDALSSAKKIIKDYEDGVDADKERSLAYENMLRILASLGLSIGVFGHEIKGSTNLTSATLSLIKIELDKLPNDTHKSELQNHYDELTKSIGRVFDLGGYVEDLTSHTGTRKLKRVPIRGTVNRFVKQFGSYLDKNSITFDIDETPKGLRTCKMHPSEMDSVLFNLMTNSMKAFRRAKTKNPKIKISAEARGKHVFLRFEDNGHSISEVHKERIFDPFFTTTEYSEDDVAGPGTGLGLTIVSDIAENYGGTIELVSPSRGFKTCFEFSVNNRDKK